uniref:N-acetylneuraminate lyase n=1 Tax=Panthera leo TaxID=9689 RepID=A0A8C8XEP1_PANLE
RGGRLNCTCAQRPGRAGRAALRGRVGTWCGAARQRRRERPRRGRGAARSTAASGSSGGGPPATEADPGLSDIFQQLNGLPKEETSRSCCCNHHANDGAWRNQLFSHWSVRGLSCGRTGSEEYFWLDQVVIHVGALSLKESQELARHAAEIGADGIAVIAPFFLKPWNKVRAEELLDGIQEKIPTFQGLKFSDTDLLDFGQCVDQNRERQFAFLFGVDEQLLSALVMGATGAVGSTYNYLGKKTNQMLEAFERKDFSSALNHQFCIQRFINFVLKLGFGVSQTKAIMTLVSGIPMGPPRPPLQRASREFIDEAKARLESLDFLSSTDLKDRNLESCS